MFIKFYETIMKQNSQSSESSKINALDKVAT